MPGARELKGERARGEGVEAESMAAEERPLAPPPSAREEMDLEDRLLSKRSLLDRVRIGAGD